MDDNVIEIRGHHIDSMASDFAYSEGFIKTGEYRTRSILETSPHIDQGKLSEYYKKLIFENPLVRLTDEPDFICSYMCHFGTEIDGKLRCMNNSSYIGPPEPAGIEEMSRKMRTMDDDAFKEWGINAGDTMRFSHLFKILVNNFLIKRGNSLEDVLKEFHPRLIELYRSP